MTQAHVPTPTEMVRGWLNRNSAQRAVASGGMSGLSVITHPGMATAPPRQRTRRGFAEVTAEAIGAVNSWLRTRTERKPDQRTYYPPRREESFEEAAMAREMYRL
jgi:hypothetical protein